MFDILGRSNDFLGLLVIGLNIKKQLMKKLTDVFFMNFSQTLLSLRNSLTSQSVPAFSPQGQLSADHSENAITTGSNMSAHTFG